MSDSTIPAPPAGWRATIRRIPCLVHGHNWVSQQYVGTTWQEYRRCRSCGRIEQ